MTDPVRMGKTCWCRLLRVYIYNIWSLLLSLQTAMFLQLVERNVGDVCHLSHFDSKA